MDIDRLANQNPWWADKTAIEKDDKVRKVIETGEKIVFVLKRENQVLIGPRQLGKTTALKYDAYHRIKKENFDPRSILYYSFDSSRHFEEILDVLDTFVSDTGKKLAYLDEVSFVPEWQRAIKQFLDSEKSRNVTLHITGSSSINLKKELMPGRGIKFFEFLPLSFREFLLGFASKEVKDFLTKHSAHDFNGAIEQSYSAYPFFRELDRRFKAYIDTGGYPDAIFDYDKAAKISDDTYDVHWNAFVSDISKAGKSIEIATAIIYGIVESYASKINLSAIARMQGVKSHVTVRDYIEAFEDLFVCKSIFPSAGRRYMFRKERKVYFNDPFLYNIFAKKTNIIDKERESKVVEGILYNHLYRFVNKNKTIAEPKTAVSFYSGKREVDFVVGDFGFEAKWQNEVRSSDFPNAGIRHKILLSKKTLQTGKDSVKILPLPLFLSVLSV